MHTQLRSVRAKASVPALLWSAIAGTVIATAVNSALFLATSSWAFPPDAIAHETGAPVQLFEVAISTIVGGVLAFGGYALVRRFVPALHRPNRLYALAVLLLVLLAYGPFTIENVGAAQIVVMQLMHVVAGLVPLYALLRAERS